MSTLTLRSFVPLGGVMQPGGPHEDRGGAFLPGGWVVPRADAAIGAFREEVSSRAGALLPGRGTSPSRPAARPAGGDAALDP